jgi:hypothetical protein
MYNTQNISHSPSSEVHTLQHLIKGMNHKFSYLTTTFLGKPF